MLSCIVFLWILRIAVGQKDEWIRYKDIALLINARVKATSYISAKRNCEFEDATLSIFHDLEKLEFIKENIPFPPILTPPYRFYVTAQLNSIKTNYFWNDGTLLADDDDNWDVGQPDKNLTDVMMGNEYYYVPELPFASAQSRAQAHYICEKAWVSVVTTSRATTTSTSTVSTTTETTEAELTTEMQVTEGTESETTYAPTTVEIAVTKGFPILLVSAGGGGGLLFIVVVIMSIVIIQDKRKSAKKPKKTDRVKKKKKRGPVQSGNDAYYNEDFGNAGTNTNPTRPTRRSTLYFRAKSAYQVGKASLFSIFSAYVDTDASRRNVSEV